MNPASLVGCLLVKVFILITVNRKWQRLICSINSDRVQKSVCSCERVPRAVLLILYTGEPQEQQSGYKHIPWCTGWEGRSVLWGEEYHIKHEVAFVICLSKPGGSVSDSQRKLGVGSCLPIWEEGDWDRTFLMFFLWEPFSTSWKPVSCTSPWKGRLEYADIAIFIKHSKVLTLVSVFNHLYFLEFFWYLY